MVHWIGVDDVRSWYGADHALTRLGERVGATDLDPAYSEEVLGVPLHLDAVVRDLAGRGELTDSALDSISFHSLCRGLLLPLAGTTPEKAAQLFGLVVPPPPSFAEREVLIRRFLERDLGLGIRAKVGCLLGDPFEGKPSHFRRESLLRLLLSVKMATRRELLDRLTIVGDVGVLFAESRPELRSDPPLTAAEVLHTLRLVAEVKRNRQFELLRSLLERTGKLEAFFLARLVLGKAGLRYENELLAKLVGERFGVEGEAVQHAMALTDVFHVVRLLEAEGADGLRKVELQPLVAVRPALAGGTLDTVRRFPVWVERKYDGIRLMLHRAVDRSGAVLCGAYSRNRRDYLEALAGLDATIKALPGASLIVDGELHGTTVDRGGPRPATVYEVMGALQGDGPRPVQLRYAAFDLLYWNGHDLTGQPLRDRRARLVALLQPLAGMPLPIPVAASEGQSAAGVEDLKRLYQHFRNQGYEGILAKDPEGPYRLGARDPAWAKRKPEVTLDLVLLGAVLAVTTKERTGMFGSYVIGARSAEGFEDVGDVAGIDVERDLEIQRTIMSEGLLTGQRIERAGVSGVRPGFELAPHVVVTVRLEGLIRDPASGRLRLRDPKLAVIRADKAPHEIDSMTDLESLYLRQTVG